MSSVFPAGTKRDVVVLRLDVVDPIDGHDVHLRAVADDDALEDGVGRPRGGRDAADAAGIGPLCRSRTRAIAGGQPLRAKTA